MAVYARSGTTATGTTSVIATAPTCNVGDLLEFPVETNGSASTTPSPGTWATKIALTVANSRRLVVYTKLAESVDVWGTQAYTAGGLTSGTTSAGRIHVIAPTVAGGALTIPTSTVGTDTSVASSAFSAAGSSISTVSGDYLSCLGLVTSSTAVLTGFTSAALTQAGATIGSVTQQQFATGSAGLYGLGLWTAAITTGGTGIPTMAGTGSGSSTVGGVAGFIPIHEVAATGIVKVNGPIEKASVSGAIAPFSYTSVKVGNLIVMPVAGFDSSPLVSSVTSSHGTWSRATLATGNFGGGTIPAVDVWICPVTTVTTANITITAAGTNTLDEAIITEFDSQLGTTTTWATSSTGSGFNASAATNAVTGLTPTAQDLVIVLDLATVASGTISSPSGFVSYITPTNGYAYSYQLSAVGGSITPTWNSSAQAFLAIGASFTPSVAANYSDNAAVSGSGTVSASAALINAATVSGSGSVAAGVKPAVARPAALSGSGTVTAAATLPYLRGVNSAGADFGDRFAPTTGTYDSDASFAFYAAQGHKLIRIPFLWEHIQPTLSSALDSGELARLTSAVNSCTTRGMTVILDVHNYARYESSGGTTNVIGDGTLTQAQFVDLWTRLSTAFKSNSAVQYGLMNEPHDLPAAIWEAAAQAAVTAIRGNSDTNWIWVSSIDWGKAQTYWSNHPTWFITDASSRSGPDGHFYFDYANGNSGEYADGGSTFASDTSAAGGNLTTKSLTDLGSFISGCQSRGLRGLVGEIGWQNTGSDSASYNAVGDALYSAMDAASIHCTYWAAGEAWEPDPGSGDPYYNLAVYTGVPQSTATGVTPTVLAHPSSIVPVFGAAGLSGAGTVTATSRPDAAGSAATSGTGGVSAVGSAPSGSGSAAASGSGSVSAVAGHPTAAGGAATSGAGSVSVATAPTVGGAAATSSTGTASTVQGLATSTTAATSSTGTVSTGQVPAVGGSASTSGSGTVVGATAGSGAAAASTSGTGTVAATQIPSTGTTAGTSGIGTVTVTVRPATAGTAATSSSGTVTAGSGSSYTATANTSGSGTVSGVGRPLVGGSGATAGSGTVVATAGAPSAFAGAAVSGSGTVAAIGALPRVAGNASTSGAGQVTCLVTAGLSAGAALSGSGTVTVTGTPSGASKNIIFHALLAAQIPRYQATLGPRRYAATVGDRRYSAALEVQP